MEWATYDTHLNFPGGNQASFILSFNKKFHFVQIILLYEGDSYMLFLLQ